MPKRYFFFYKGMKYVQCDNVRSTPGLLIFVTSRIPAFEAKPFPDKPIGDPPGEYFLVIGLGNPLGGVLPSNRPLSTFTAGLTIMGLHSQEKITDSHFWIF